MNKWSIGQAKHIEKQAPSHEGNEYVLARCRHMKIHVLAKRFGPPAKTSRDFDKHILVCRCFGDSMRLDFLDCFAESFERKKSCETSPPGR